MLVVIKLLITTNNVRGTLARAAWAAGVHNCKRLLILVEFHVEIWQLCWLTTVT